MENVNPGIIDFESKNPICTIDDEKTNAFLKGIK